MNPDVLAAVATEARRKKDAYEARMRRPAPPQIYPWHRLFAAGILAFLPLRLRAAARQGQRCAEVMGVYTFCRTQNGTRMRGSPSEEWLTGTARVVFDECAKKKLNPYLAESGIYYDDGTFVGSGYYLAVKW